MATASGSDRTTRWDPALTRVRRLAAARLVSVAGGAAAYLCIVYVVFQETGSSAWVAGAMVSIIGLQSAVLPLAGALADRLDRRAVMIGSDVLAGCLFLGMTRDLPLPAFLALAVAASVAEAPFLPASSAAVPALVGTEDLLSRANGAIGAASSTGRTLGPVLGGVALTALGPHTVFVLNSASFALSAVLILSLGPLPGGEPLPHARRLRTSVQVVLGNRRLRLLLWSSAAAYVSTSFAMVAEPSLVTRFGWQAVGYGLMTAAWGLGLVGGSWFAGRYGTRSGDRRLLVRARLVMGAGLLLIAFCPTFWPVPLCMLVGGAGSGVVLVTALSETQRNSPAALRGTIVAVMEAVGTASFIGGVVLAGLLVDLVGVMPAYLIAGTGTLLAAVPLHRNAAR